MLPLFKDNGFRFRFADDRIVPRIHLEGVEIGRVVSVFRVDVASGERIDLLSSAVAGEGGWVDLPEPLIVRAGDEFVAVLDNTN